MDKNVDFDKKISVFVIQNEKNQYLFSYDVDDKKWVDIGIVSAETTELDEEEVFIQETGYCVEDCIEFSKLTAVDDEDGHFDVYFARVKWNQPIKTMYNLDNKYFWASYSMVKKLHHEGRINDDQYYLISKARNKVNSQKRSKSLIKQMVYDKYKNNRPIDDDTKAKLTRRIELGHCIVPTDKSNEEKARLIISTDSHESIKNFPDILNNEELLLEFASLAPNPIECEDYFFGRINEYILAKQEFRIEFLRRIYLNEHVYLIEDIDKFVEMYGLEKENDVLLFDKVLREKLMVRLSKVHTYPKFEESGCKNDKQYRKLKDELTELNKKKENGLRVIIARLDDIQENLKKEEEIDL